VLDSYFNLTNKSNPIDRRFNAIFYHLVVAYIFALPCILILHTDVSVRACTSCPPLLITSKQKGCRRRNCRRWKCREAAVSGVQHPLV